MGVSRHDSPFPDLATIRGNYELWYPEFYIGGSLHHNCVSRIEIMQRRCWVIEHRYRAMSLRKTFVSAEFLEKDGVTVK